MRLVALWVVLLCGYITSSVAAENGYEVELIVIAHAQAKPGQENWPVHEVAMFAQENFSHVAQEKISPLATDEFRLKAEAQRIAADPRFEVLLHKAWRQPGKPKEQALPVYIHSGNSNNEELPRLEGYVRLILTRYLHLETDLQYRSHGISQRSENSFYSAVTATEPIYKITETRRMRSNELHYIDHPMFGILALVTPEEKPTVKPIPAPVSVNSPEPPPAAGSTGAIRRD
ncbi:MAG: CsiV family protein [Thiohalomonadaceae bacterium]